MAAIAGLYACENFPMNRVNRLIDIMILAEKDNSLSQKKVAQALNS
jgi:hypothetical protein